MTKMRAIATTTALSAVLLSSTVLPAQAAAPAPSTISSTAISSTVLGWGSWWGGLWGGGAATVAPSVSSHTATHTSTGMTLKAVVKDYDGRVTLRASAKPLTGQTGWYVTATPNWNDEVNMKLTKFDNTAKRYWQLETSTGKVIASGTVAPKSTTTPAPAPAPTTTPTKAPSPAPTTTPTKAPTTPAPTPTTSPTKPPTTTTPAPAPAPTVSGQKKSGFITGYAIHDNDPYGSKGIAYSKSWNSATIHTEAGGTGTYDDPITIAAPKDTYAPGTRIYLPHVKRYGMVEDLCATSWTATSGCTSVLDLWVGGEMSDKADDTRKCNEKITGTYDFYVNPGKGLPVTAGSLFNSSTDTCTAVTK